MQAFHARCPVCSQPGLTALMAFCPQCEYENIQISTLASPELKEYFQQKLEHHQSLYNKSLQLHEANSQHKATIERIVREKTELYFKNQKLESEQNERNRLADENNQLKEEIKRLTLYLQKINAELKAEKMGKFKF